MNSNTHQASNPSSILIRALQFATFSLGASLPFKDQYSTFAMLLILALGLWAVLVQKEAVNWKRLARYWWIPVLLLLPRIMGLFYGQWDNATKELLRSIPLVLVPLSFVLLSGGGSSKKIRNWFFYGAVLGIVLMAIICYYPVISTMIKQDQPLSFLLRWRYMNFNFTKPIDAHPAYLGLLIVWLIVHVLFSNIIALKWRIWISLGLVILLFQLVARNALFLAGIAMAIYVVKSKIKWLQLSAVALLFTVIGLVVWHPSTYLRDKFFYIFIEDAKVKENTRFDRLEASFEVFRQAPVFGPGPGTDNEKRMEAYLKMGEIVAYENNYNAHNQFVEILSTFGIVGISCFLIAILLAVTAVLKNKNWIDLLLLGAIIVAMLTESLLERALGVKYLSILIAFILLNHLNNQRENSLPDGSRP